MSDDEAKQKKPRFGKLFGHKTFTGTTTGPDATGGTEVTEVEQRREVGRRIARWADESDLEAALAAEKAKTDPPRISMHPTPADDPDAEAEVVFAEPAPKKRFGHKAPKPTPVVEETAPPAPTEPVVLADYHYRTRESRGRFIAQTHEFPQMSATGATPEAAIENLKARLVEHVAGLVAAGEPIPEPYDLPVDPSYGESLFVRRQPVVEHKGPLAERAQKTWKRATRPNRPDIQWDAKKNITKAEAREQTKRSITTAGGWLVSAAVAWGLLYGQTAVNFDAVSDDLYGAMLSPSDLIVYSDPVSTTELERAELVRVTRTDGLVEFGFFEKVNADGDVVLNIPALEDKSVVKAEEVATISNMLPGLAVVKPVVTSPVLAAVPLVLYGAFSLWSSRRRAKD